MSIALALAAIFVGVIIGATGVGGVLLIPALMFFGGLGVHQAMATALFSFFFTGIAATCAFQRHGSIDWKIALPVCFGSLVLSYFGALAGAYAPANALALLLAGLIIASSLFPFVSLKRADLAQRLGPRGNLALLTGIGLFTGFLCGMTGAGGGIVSLPVMLLFGYPPLAAIGTGQVLQSIVSVSGSLSNYGNGFIDFSLVWPVTIAEVAGVILGVRIIHALPIARVKRYATMLCLAIGVYMAARALFFL